MKSVQQKLFEHLKQSVSPHVSLAEELAELLNVSTDSAYRRLRGDTALSIDEASLLCRKFNLSLDSLLNTQSNLVTFNYKSFIQEDNSLWYYVESMKQDLEQLKSIGGAEVCYAAEDVPVFHHFAYPELCAFKFFHWQKAILLRKELQNTRYSADVVDKEILQKAREIYALYSELKSTEIWTTETITSSLKQLEFFWEAGHFKKKDDALLICSQIEAMAERIRDNAEKESKNEGFDKNYTLYQSDIMIGNNSIVVNVKGQLRTYLSFNTFNTLSTSNDSFSRETDTWMKNLIRKSDLISGVAEKHRAKFFKTMLGLIHATQKKIEEN